MGHKAVVNALIAKFDQGYQVTYHLSSPSTYWSMVSHLALVYDLYLPQHHGFLFESFYRLGYSQSSGWV